MIRAIARLRSDRYRELYAGRLCTIEVRNDPVATYDALAALDPPAIDFLLPPATWDPAARSRSEYAVRRVAGVVSYRWLADDGRPPVRMFESIVRTFNAAARQAFGAVGVALPEDGETLALLLIHEFQHVKLGAMLDVFELCDPVVAGRLFYAPWRDDPRPVEALLQGTYADLGVTDYCAPADTGPRLPSRSWRGNALLDGRRLPREAIGILAGLDPLTDHGDRVVASHD